MSSKAKKVVDEKEEGIWETVKIILQALAIAFVIRLFFFQPFNIPSESMVPTLRIGDYLFVNKMSYGYGPYSFNFTIGFRDWKLYSLDKVPFSGRILKLGSPKRGDVVVFKYPPNPQQDYIKRLVGLPGDTIQVRSSVLYINGKAIKREPIGQFVDEYDPTNVSEKFKETMDDGRSYVTLNRGDHFRTDNTEVITVPPHHYFMMGDNRDNSADSRIWGFVPEENLVGPATIKFFSHTKDASLWKFWNWPFVIRWSRLFRWIQS